MKVFTCTDHDGFYHVGVASVIVAVDEAHAAELLRTQLYLLDLDPFQPFTLDEVSLSRPVVVILNDGNY